MKTAKVSIVVPVYNSEEYLEACICSIIKQTYSNWELILVNDGSSDASEEICKHYVDNDVRIKYVFQTNKGVSSARNTGMDHMTGEYLTFVDSDDELMENAISVLMDDILKYDADISSGVACLIKADGRVAYPYDDKKVCVYENEEALVRSLMYDRQTNAVWAKMFSHRLIHNVRFVEGHNINEDGYFLFQCYTKQPKVVQHNVSIYRYYERANSASHGVFSEKYFDMLYFCDLKMQYIKECAPRLLKQAYDMEVSTHIFFLGVLCKADFFKYRKAEKASINVVRRRYFQYHPVNKYERKMATIITFGLYRVYKFFLKYCTNLNSNKPKIIKDT